MDAAKLHPSEITGHLQYRLRAGALMWTATGLAFALGLGSMAIDELSDRRFHWLRTGIITSGLVAAVIARFAQENVVQKGLITLDAEDISDASRQQRFYEAMAPQAQGAVLVDVPAGPYQPELFNLGDLVTQPRKYPHMIFLAPTGSGKTTLVEALHALMPGQKVALHPHWQPPGPGERADFDYADQVIGRGRDFAAIAEYIEGLYCEMDRRSKLTHPEMRAEPFINVVVDELPATAANCPSSTIDQLVSLLFESRKFGIRLMVMACDDSVKVLNLEGKGGVRDNLSYVRLGQASIAYAKRLVNKKLADIGLIGWLQNQAYPCMVEDSPAVIPAISQGQFIAGAPLPPNGPGGGGNLPVTQSSGITPGVTVEGNSLEASGGNVLPFPSSLPSAGVTRPYNPTLEAILKAAAEGNLDGAFLKTRLNCPGKYYAGAKRVCDMLTGVGPTDLMEG